MRIAYFTDTYLPQINGVTHTLKKLSDYLVDQNIEHKFFAPEYEDKAFPHSSNVTRFKSISLPFYPECRLSLPLYSNLSRAVDNFQPDLIHLTDPLGIGLAGLKYARERDIPVVSSFHTNFDSYLKYYKMEYLEGFLWGFFQWFHSFSEVNFCPSLATWKVLESKNIRNLRLWSRGVDSFRFDPKYHSLNIRSNLLKADDKILFLYVGRLAVEKDLDILMNSIQMINQKDRNRIQFVFVGDGPYAKEMKALEEDNVIFTGYLQGQELSSLYASCDVFVFPSSTETFGNVVLEAMSSGLPVIAVNSGGVVDNVIHSYNGLLCTPRDSVALADAILKLTDDQSLRKQLASNARAYALTKSWDYIFNQLLLDYQSVLEKSQNLFPETA